jgi:hypothetical protein
LLTGLARQILTADYEAAYYTALVAVCLALAGTYAFEILKRFFISIQRWWDRNHEDNNPQLQPLLSDGTQANNEAPQTVAAVLQQSNGGRELFVNSVGYVLRKGSRYKIWLTFLGTAVLTLFVARAVAGVFSAHVATGRVALWSSDHCGVWQFDSDRAGEGASTRADVYDREKEFRAGEYAKYCYDTSDKLQSMYCGFFYQPNISFTTSYSYECPFADEEVCVLGSPAVTFDTGLVDASNIGVNDKVTYKFRRWTTCSPLNVGPPYVRNQTTNGTTTFYYYYGQTVDGDKITNYTFSSTGNPFSWLAPAYHVK